MIAPHNSYLFHLAEPEEESPPMVGIARLAAQGEFVRPGHDVRYYTLESRSLLNRVRPGDRRMPFTWTINPYRGCEFACKYCYARYTHEFMEMRDGLDFERKIYIKQQAGWLLRRDLKRVKPGEQIAIGTATDPYQPAERHYRVTRAILEELALHRGFEIGIVTKSDLILRDRDLLRCLGEQNRVYVNLTITTLDTKLARILEPRAPRPDLRLKAVEELNRAGIDAGVICAPVVPGITDSEKSLEELVAAVKKAGGKNIFANPLFLKPCSAAVFLPFLEREFPQLVEDYRKRYQERAFVSPVYQRQISKLMARLREKYGIAYERESRPKRQPAEACAQLTLFPMAV
ncbi:MAG: radical SAM protein [Candidatus Korobacteraceae bacterium]|jgi:DNA repair photolyase